MKNEKLITYMTSMGVNVSQLSKLSGIPQSTLRRIIDGVTHNVKPAQMEAIARALKTPVHTLFDVPMEGTMYSALLPDEAGIEVMKQLSPEESLLLYLYQNSGKSGRSTILAKAKSEYYRMQTEVLNRPLDQTKEPEEPEFAQMSITEFMESGSEQ